MVHAAKPVWNGKTFEVQVVRDVHNLGGFVQAGYFVYDDAARVLKDAKNGKFLSHWGERKRAAAIEFLEGEVAHADEIAALLVTHPAS